MEKKSRKKTRAELEINQVHITLAMFLVDYNQNIPNGFPQATPATLRRFQKAHPTLFKQENKWSVARHRKRLMDWLSSNPELL